MELIKWFPLLQVSHFTTVLDGIRSYHNTVLRNVEINGQTVTAPPKVALNIYNITKKLKAVFQGYKSSKTDNNPYDALMHDAIQTFSWELNGVFKNYWWLFWRASHTITNIPWALTEIERGSLNTTKLISHVLKVKVAVHPETNPALHKFIEQDIRDNIAASHIDLPWTPMYFECCQSESIDWKNKTVQLIFRNWPKAIMADWCSVNAKGGRI